jgi:hypothetical protein
MGRIKVTTIAPVKWMTLMGNVAFVRSQSLGSIARSKVGNRRGHRNSLRKVTNHSERSSSKDGTTHTLPPISIGPTPIRLSLRKSVRTTDQRRTLMYKYEVLVKNPSNGWTEWEEYDALNSTVGASGELTLRTDTYGYEHEKVATFAPGYWMLVRRKNAKV